MIDPVEVLEAMEAHQRVGAIQVKDGHVLTFPVAVLEHLLASAKGSAEQKVLIFIKHPVKQ